MYRVMQIMNSLTFVFLLLLTTKNAFSVRVPLTSLKSYEKAKCMDGSSAAYYFYNNNSSKFVIELQGGGECATLEQCSTKIRTPLGSSKYFQPSISSFSFLNDLNAKTNPTFSSFNHIFVPYCSQDLWTGTRYDETDPYFHQFYFAGHEIFSAVLEDLDYLLSDSTEIILTGESAGGIGVWNNVDFLAAQYPNARVGAVPIAGFYFFAFPYDGPHHTSSVLVDFRESAWPSHYTLWGSYVDEDCMNALSEPSHCILSNYSFPFINTTAFIVEAQSDKVVLTDHDWVPSDEGLWDKEIMQYLSTWQANMSKAIFDIALKLRPDDGAFFPSCFIHTDFSAQAPLIENTSYIDAVKTWWTTNERRIWGDDCGLLCNPTCSH